ncbi:MAG: peptidylprolyl isomerase [Pyrinomonadaceae bacterium]|nr:peptidylprolyl isomerase [Pyrinomonadaceae bacterium]
MKKNLIICLAVLCFSLQIFAQVPTATLVNIVKAEDERRYDKTLEDLMKNPVEQIRIRAALAAGRIGDDKAIPMLVSLLSNDSDAVRPTAAFALSEIESLKAADAILKVLKAANTAPEVRARLVEAAGKIAAANAKDAKAIELGAAILDVLSAEAKKTKQDRLTILLGLTAILRAKPEKGDFVAAKFLINLDARVRADAANTLSRIRVKNANEPLRAMLLADDDATARANAARALGAAEDQDAFAVLLEAAVKDVDSRVRVSAIRSLGSLKNKKAAAKLLERGEKLIGDFASGKTTYNYPTQKSELLEITVTLGRILPNTGDEFAASFLQAFRNINKIPSPEIEIAYARVAPAAYLKNYRAKNQSASWQTVSSLAQGLGEFANSPDENLKLQGRTELVNYFSEFLETTKPAQVAEMNKAAPDLIRAIAAFKADGLSDLLREMINTQDVFVRAVAAELLGEQPANKENAEALQKAFNSAFVTDKDYNDAQLAILDALFKLDKNEAEPTFYVALNSKDYLVRKKAFDFLSDKDLQKSDLVRTTLEKYAAGKKNLIAPFVSSSKLGQILNTNADYTRAVSRKNGQAKAILTTDKGSFTIEFAPEDAPLTVDNFIKLAKANYFNGLEIHRVVPNFVMQDGDPRGDGNGGPGWQIRCEMNMQEYERGAVGMALSGKDTGGSQWFVTHAPQPHLDGGYTVFGRVNETDMKVVDNLVRGDKITSVKIVEGNLPQRTPRRKN